MIVEGLDSRLASATAGVETAKARVAENQAARRAVEKDLAMIQARLSKFKGQLMEVKTNKEYTAMLKEIEVAQHEVGVLEEKILERMLEADGLVAGQKEAEAKLASDKGVIAAERKQIGEETERLQARAGGSGRPAERAGGRDVARGPGHVRHGARQARHGRGRSEGRLLQRVPRATPAAGRQRTPPERDRLPVRKLPAHSLLPGSARVRGGRLEAEGR